MMFGWTKGRKAQKQLEQERRDQALREAQARKWALDAQLRLITLRRGDSASRIEGLASRNA